MGDGGLNRRLLPRHRHGRFFAVAIAASIFWPVLEPSDETDQLLDGFFVSPADVFHFQGDRVSEIWTFVDDQYADDEFFG